MSQHIDVLVVDDDDITPEMVSRALRKVEGHFRVVAASDGMEALAILNGQASQTVSRPYMILLDLNMPRMNGFEFLSAVRSNEALMDSVIFVLTTSSSDNDRMLAYSEQVAGYMTKSAIGPQFARLSALLHDYSTAVTLPS